MAEASLLSACGRGAPTPQVDRCEADASRYEGTPPTPNSLPVRLADSLLWLYQKTLSPALTVVAPSCGCRFAPTCSHYARAALREHGLLAGSAFAARRLLKCGPWHPGGLDPVPPRKFVCAKTGTSSRSDRSLLTANRSLS